MPWPSTINGVEVPVCFGKRFLNQGDPRLIRISTRSKKECIRIALKCLPVFFPHDSWIQSAVRAIPNRSSLIITVVIIRSCDIQFVIDDLRYPFPISEEDKSIHANLLIPCLRRGELGDQLGKLDVDAQTAER